MKTQFTRDLICFDLETTGLDKVKDRIIQIAIVILDKELNVKDRWTTLINPEGVPISSGAFNVHHLTSEMLCNQPKFAEVFNTIKDYFTGKDILTYNGNTFDIQFINNAFKECGYELETADINCFDSYYIESILNPRTLSNTYKKYTGDLMSDSHNAVNDVNATIEVFKKQLELIDINTVNSKLLSPDNTIELIDDQYIIKIGKYKGRLLSDIIKLDRDYIAWLIKSTKSRTLFTIVQNLLKH